MTSSACARRRVRAKFFVLASPRFFATIDPASCIGLIGLVLMATRYRGQGAGSRCCACILLARRRPVAARQRDHPAARGALPALGRLARRADRHHRARRRARHRGVAGARRGRAERGGRADDRGRRARAALSRCAHRVHRRHPGRIDLRRRRRKPNSRARLFESFGIAEAAHRARGQVARHRRERALHQGAGAAEARRALADRHLGASHAALGRRVPCGGISVEAFPVDYRTRGAIDLLRPFATLGDGLRRTDTAIKEWVGLVVYWLTDKTSELLPGPA